MSTYPDGTTRQPVSAFLGASSAAYRTVHSVVPDAPTKPSYKEDTRIVSTNPIKVPRKRVSRILSHRIQLCQGSPVEEYLVEWRTTQPAQRPPFSWHNVDELCECLAKLQVYVDSHALGNASRLTPVTSNGTSSNGHGTKRKSPDFVLKEYGLEPQQSPDLTVAKEHKAYHGKLGVEDGYYVMRQALPTDTQLKISPPWKEIYAGAAFIGDRLPQARDRIRAEFNRQLAAFRSGRSRVSLVNVVDASVPSLNFKLTEEYRLGNGVTAMDPETIVGCGAKYEWANQRCSPHMGQSIGCEYSRVCDCMEYADIDKTRLKDHEREWLAANPGDTRMDLPKRFPYFSSSHRAGCLVPFYLASRSPIYECNDKCSCGPGCKNRLVQKGCRIPLEIFRTSNGRGWGLRCGVDLRPGDFIDTYRGEIITGDEADRREKHKKRSASYLFTLDKFAGDESGLEYADCYVVDGEYMGGPTRFINHSCDPNCQQHTVSLNKFDRKIYLLAFFANQHIPRGTELTFDYMDKDGEVEEPDDDEDKQPCLCGSTNCRGILWM